jgi:hypothetical protein
MAENEILCCNAKYNGKLDCFICSCCEAEGGNDTQAKDLKPWQEVTLIRDNTVWFVSEINGCMLTLVPTRSPRHKNVGILVYDYEVKPL